MGRAMFCWNKADMDSKTDRNNLVAFCAANNITTVLLHFYQWIGAGNWSSSNVDNLKALIAALHDVAVDVYGLIGGVDYAVNQLWVRRNIIGAMQAFNATSQDHAFAGLVFDCEYWTEPQNYDPEDYIPAYYRLIDAARAQLDIPVGVFAQRSLLDAGRDEIDYRGLNDVDGAHLLRASDFVFVGSYDDHAEPHDSYPGQIAMIEPWVDRADNDGLGTMVWGCSEVSDVAPSWITYYGSTKAAMETQHGLIASALLAGDGGAYVGQAVHAYSAYRDM